MCMNGPSWSNVRRVTPHLGISTTCHSKTSRRSFMHFVSQLQMFLGNNLGSENGICKAMIVWYLLVVCAMLSGFWVWSREATGSSNGFLSSDGIVSDLPLSVKLLNKVDPHMKGNVWTILSMWSFLVVLPFCCSESHEKSPWPFNIFSFCLM